MWDFQYRASMDTYEQLNGKLKAPPVVYEPVDAPAGPAPPPPAGGAGRAAGESDFAACRSRIKKPVDQRA
jgi:hypothetical protein